MSDDLDCIDEGEAATVTDLCPGFDDDEDSDLDGIPDGCEDPETDTNADADSDTDADSDGDTDADGDGDTDTVVDGTEPLPDRADVEPVEAKPVGCTCDAAPAGSLPAPALLVLASLRRRRPKIRP